MKTKACIHCGKDFEPKRKDSKYCSRSCGAAYKFSLLPKVTDSGRTCIVCGKHFPLNRNQGQKKTCSDGCRRARVAQIIREWHKRNPDRESLYRQRTKEKQPPGTNLVRFYRHNPGAPNACESCGENRVLDVAHKPGHERNGQWRNKNNTKWPQKVWILCPTCHALIDRMHYSPEELGLTP